MQPIVVISADKGFGKQLTTAVNAAGATGHLHSSIAALGEGNIEAALLILHLVDDSLASLEALLPRVIGDTRVIAILPRANLVAAVDIMRASERVNAMMVAERFDSHELVGIASRVLAGDIFGIEKTLRWGTHVHSQLVGDYEGKSVAISRISQFAQQMNVRRKYRDSIEQCVDEMLMNALYDAPVDDHGRPLFSSMTAKTRVALTSQHNVAVQYACDGRKFVVSVRDEFGTLERGTVLQYLHKCLHANQQIDSKPGGAGLGLYLMVNSATNVLFNVLPGVATEVVCTFDLETAKPQLEELAFFCEKPETMEPEPTLQTRAVKRRSRGLVRILTLAIAVLVALIGFFAWQRLAGVDGAVKPSHPAAPIADAATDRSPHALGGSAGNRDRTTGSEVAAVDWETCNAALRRAAAESPAARPGIVIAGCNVCGDWEPILRWSTLQTDGGPSRAAIEAAMARCGYCNSNAKQRFLGTLDNARGTAARTPWRLMGEICQAEVSATPDNRFTSAPFYALDRIARAGFAKGGDTADLLTALTLPLPAVSITGNGMALPHVTEGVQPDAGSIAITLVGPAIHVARLPRARMTATGLAVELGGYPGEQVELAELGARLKQLAGDDKPVSVALLAPLALPAETLVPVVAAAASVSTVYLAANAPGVPEGWELPGTIPVAIGTKGADTYAVPPKLTVQDLASELVRRGQAGQKSVALAVKR